MEEPLQKEKHMNDQAPVTVTTDNNPSTTEDTVVTARFNRKKLAQWAGTAAAVVGGLAIFGSVMKTRGKAELIEDARCSSDDTDEPASS
jgi:hypothetical protein